VSADVTLTEAERDEVIRAGYRVSSITDQQWAAIERIVGARVQQAESERNALRARIWALGESIYGDDGEGAEHDEGCVGAPDCLACILNDLRAGLGGPP
jgi:hypothetical protein